jgi:hypothetical protein
MKKQIQQEQIRIWLQQLLGLNMIRETMFYL